MNLYASESYVDFLRFQVKENKQTGGYLSKLAKAAGMHLSYLTKVFKEEAHLTPDHAAGLAELWGLDPDETQFFLLLVIRDRAATPRLKKIVDRQISSYKKTRDIVGVNRATSVIPDEHKSAYYSSWRYSAIHMALDVPAFRKEDALARRFGLAPRVIASTLEHLEKMGFVQRAGQGWKRKVAEDLYLDARSWLGEAHTRSWRQRLADRQVPFDEEELCYTGVHTVSRKDAMRIRILLKEAMAKAREVMDPSPAEEWYLLAVDWTKT